ncbi:hypothetical protein SOVF_141220 [Spinacia oleracea]|nr:hypothetical protein SOVF_141220 [Spinacia oleracea]
MDNGKGKNKVDEYDQEQNYEDESGISTLRQNPDIIGSSSSDNEHPETGENSMIPQPDEPLQQISTELVLAIPCSQIQRSQRLSDEGSGRKRTRETGSSSQSQIHHQLETGSSSQSNHQLESGSGISGSYHLESPCTSNYSSSLPTNNMDEGFKVKEALRSQLEVQTKLHLQAEAEKHLQLCQDAERRYMAAMIERACRQLQQAPPHGFNLSPSAPASFQYGHVSCQGQDAYSDTTSDESYTNFTYIPVDAVDEDVVDEDEIEEDDVVNEDVVDEDEVEEDEPAEEGGGGWKVCCCYIFVSAFFVLVYAWIILSMMSQ